MGPRSILGFAHARPPSLLHIPLFSAAPAPQFPGSPSQRSMEYGCGTVAHWSGAGVGARRCRWLVAAHHGGVGVCGAGLGAQSIAAAHGIGAGVGGMCGQESAWHSVPGLALAAHGGTQSPEWARGRGAHHARPLVAGCRPGRGGMASHGDLLRAWRCGAVAASSSPAGVSQPSPHPESPCAVVALRSPPCLPPFQCVPPPRPDANRSPSLLVARASMHRISASRSRL